MPPLVKVVADKATFKYWSDNLTGSDKLIQAIFLAAWSAGYSLSKSMDIPETLDSFKISPSYFTGLAADGAYSHCGVGEKLGQRLGIPGYHDTDFCHLGTCLAYIFHLLSNSKASLLLPAPPPTAQTLQPSQERVTELSLLLVIVSS